MRNHFSLHLVSLLTVLPGPLLSAQTDGEAASDSSRKVAIITANRADVSLDDQLPVFEDMLTAHLADAGFGLISRGIVIDAVGSFEQGSPENALDAALDDQTSALRLSRNLGADYLLFASVIGFDKESRKVKAYDVSYTNEVYTLRTSYRIIDGNTGEAIVSDRASASRTIQQSTYSSTQIDGLSRQLMEKAAAEMAGSLTRKDRAGRIRTVELNQDRVEMSVAVSLSDINFPEVVFNEDGQARITANRSIVQALAVTVELDGMTVGTTGTGSALTTFEVPPGIHRIRLSREDLIPWERTINIYDGMELNVSMQLTDEGLARWRENTRILNDLKTEAVMTDAKSEALKGLGQMLRQSGFSVKIDEQKKEDIKVDTDEALQIENNQSLIKGD